MAGGSYTGGSTVINGGATGWFSGREPMDPKAEQKANDKACKLAIIKTERQKLAATRKALRTQNAQRQSKFERLAKPDPQTDDIEVIIIRGGEAVLIRAPQRVRQETRNGRPRLSIKLS